MFTSYLVGRDDSRKQWVVVKITAEVKWYATKVAPTYEYMSSHDDYDSALEALDTYRRMI